LVLASLAQTSQIPEKPKSATHQGLCHKNHEEQQNLSLER